MESDENLIKEYLEGNDEALNELVRRYASHIYNFAYQYVSNQPEAEEITQDVFVKAWRSMKKFDLKRSFRAWIFQIARNTIIDYLRKKKSQAVLEIDSEDENFDIADTGPTPQEIFEKKESADRIKKIMEGLSIKYKTVLTMYYESQLNFREIAEITGESIDTIKSRHRRALIILKGKLVGKK